MDPGTGGRKWCCSSSNVSLDLSGNCQLQPRALRTSHCPCTSPCFRIIKRSQNAGIVNQLLKKSTRFRSLQVPENHLKRIRRQSRQNRAPRQRQRSKSCLNNRYHDVWKMSLKTNLQFSLGVSASVTHIPATLTELGNWWRRIKENGNKLKGFETKRLTFRLRFRLRFC